MNFHSKVAQEIRFYLQSARKLPFCRQFRPILLLTLLSSNKAKYLRTCLHAMDTRLRTTETFYNRTKSKLQKKKTKKLLQAKSAKTAKATRTNKQNNWTDETFERIPTTHSLLLLLLLLRLHAPTTGASNKFVYVLCDCLCVCLSFLCAAAAADCQKRILMKRNEIKWTFGNSLRAFLCSWSSRCAKALVKWGGKRALQAKCKSEGVYLTVCVCCKRRVNPFVAARLQSANLLVKYARTLPVWQVSLSWRALRADVRGVAWRSGTFWQTDTPI